MVTWVVQSNMLAYGQTLPLFTVLKELNIKHEDVGIIPFSEEPLLINSNVPVLIPYGSTKLTKLAQKENWKGLFFDYNTFNMKECFKQRNDMLNSDTQVLTLEETIAFVNENEDDWFIRPVNDLKLFSGTIMNGREIREWFERISFGNFEFDTESPVVISSPKNIEAEWRYFIVDGKIIDGSLYRYRGQTKRKHENNVEILNSAQELANKWLPHRCCVMDVALVNGDYKVIEFNCLNSSGFYDHDLKAIVNAVTGYASVVQW